MSTTLKVTFNNGRIQLFDEARRLFGTLESIDSIVVDEDARERYLLSSYADSQGVVYFFSRIEWPEERWEEIFWDDDSWREKHGESAGLVVKVQEEKE